MSSIHEILSMNIADNVCVCASVDIIIILNTIPFHLYKRSIFLNVVNISWYKALHILQGSISPVSYTHLDVYKRQE